MTLACEALATKAELEELKQKINKLLGKKEDGGEIDVLDSENLEGTLIDNGINLALSAIQDFGIGTIAGGIIASPDGQSITGLANGSLKYVKVQGSNVIKLLPGATGAAKTASLKLIQNAEVGKIATASGKLGSASIAVVSSLANIIASLGLNLATTKTLGFRVDQVEKGLLQIKQSDLSIFSLLQKTQNDLGKAIQEGNKTKKILNKQVAENQEIHDSLSQSEANNEILKSNVTQLQKDVDLLKTDREALKQQLEDFQGEYTEDITALQTANDQLETNLATAQTNIDTITKVTEQLAIDVANLKGKTTELQGQITAVKAIQSLTVGELIKLKQEVATNQTITNSKINLLEAKLVLAEKNLSTGNLTLDAFPEAAQQDIANTQTATLKLANTLSSNPLPSSSLEINTSQLGLNNPFFDTLTNLLPNISPQPAEVTDVQFSELETAILAGITANFNDLGLTNINPRLTTIESQTTPSAIRSSVETGICNSTNPGGCLNNNIRQPLQNSLNNLTNNTDGINAGIGALNNFLNQQILSRVNSVHTVVTANNGLLTHAQYGLQATKNFLTTAWETTRMGKILEFLSVAISLHNAAMLSRNLGASIGDTISAIANNAISLIKNEDSTPIDINATLGNSIEGFLKSIIGADNYDDLGETFTKYNRILNAASNIIWTIQGIQMGLAYGLETVGNYTGRIGNALKKSGAVLENSYNWMNEKMNFRSGRLGQLNNIINETQNVENVISEVHQVTSEFREIQEQTNYLGKQTKNLTDELTLKEEESTTTLETSKTNSQGAQPTQADYTPDSVQ